MFTSNKNSNLNEKVNTVKGNVTTIGPKAVVSDNKGNEANAVKASACWVWRPKQKVLDHLELKGKGVIDNGCSRHMTGIKSYLLDYEEIDGEFIAFGGYPKGDTECVVLSPDFKLLNENHVLLRVPRKDNMYSVDLKNIVPSGGRKLTLSFMRPFGCPVTILNTLDHLGKFDEKADEGFFVGYSTNSKTFRVFNNRTRIVEENLHVKFSEETPNMTGNGPNWLFVIDALTNSINYKPIVVGNQTNGNAGTKENIDVGQAGKKIVPNQEYILLPLLKSDPSLSKSSKDSPDAGFKLSGEEKKMDAKHPENEDSEVPNTEEPRVNQDIKDNVIDENIVYGCIDDPNMPNLEEIVYSDDDEEVGAEADMNNLATTVPVSPIPTTRVHKDHPLEQIIGDIHSAPQTRRMTKSVTEHVEPKKVIQALTDPSKIKAMQDELLYTGLHSRGRYRYDEVFAPDAKNEAIRLFLAYASFMNFIVYQMDVKSAFLCGTIEEEVYVCQPPGFEDPEFPNKVYKVEKALYCLHQAPRACYVTLSTYLLDNGFRRGTIDKNLFIKKDKDNAQEIPDEFYSGAHFLLRVVASTPMETNKALLKDEEAAYVDVHLYRSMFRSLMYLTTSRPDIMFAVCACSRFQVTPKTSHLHTVKRIFRYLKGHSKLGLWYPRDSPFDLEAFFDSDYASASLDKKSTI
ncbi:putative ribonuclease H-like domain-containing protein [Tanacetum coccineum]